jgi:cytochrome b pre-mRNA-processing protein 3
VEKPSFLSRLLLGDADRPIALQLYGGVVAMARAPHLYRGLGVPDTPEGRFEMVVTHLALVIRRMNAAGNDGLRLARLVNEAFVEDMDDCMRELGVGDLTVPKKVKKAAAGLYERLDLVAGALPGGSAEGGLAGLETGLAAALPGIDAKGLVGHLLAVVAALDEATDADLARGQLPPLPEADAAGGA